MPGLIIPYLQAGLGGLASYLAAHVLLCLVPAFLIAGGLASLIPKESVTRFLGRKAPKVVSYPAAAMAGSLLAVGPAPSSPCSPASTRRAPASDRRLRFCSSPQRPISWRWPTPASPSGRTWPSPDCSCRWLSASGSA